ncbi:Zn-ribbon domain-containing OB-fold protein [Cryptosporangium aurantiacum]|uniref:Uncharacterized OB-fold protein, contains Zn-ribbon domain n=1 Tax=Cryptosporangium aurantiacum TaxID=134849 RepID=A0A1M7PMR8_9ACTN|nr:OB-fold domain-containing protein [Cryptosporangium aurantiacum]SHN18591.1 Uncharacterized OB-fold protein, contains Zn-ribbon domain [Cryptosporangium aurantiacum]
MGQLSAVGTYLPPWGSHTVRVAGRDEDVVTMGVAAGRAALSGRSETVGRVVLVSRDLPLLDGGNGAALLAGLGLPSDVPVVEQVGGAPAALDAVAGAAPGTLVIAADLAPAGAAAVLVDTVGPEVEPVARVTRSLPVRARGRDGVTRDYDDPRLERDRGAGVAVDRLALPSKPAVVAGLAARQASALAEGRPPALPTTGASAALFALAALTGAGLVLAVEQASAAAVTVDGLPAVVRRDERSAAPMDVQRETPGPEIALPLAAYERAFTPKLRWEAAACAACGTLAFPPRYRCLGCGAEGRWAAVPLPRTGEVYTAVTVHVPVPGIATPYSLVIVELDDVGVRALVPVTGVRAGTAGIGDRGRLVFRRMAVRTGIPDYGYALLPERPDEVDGWVTTAGSPATEGGR